MRRLTKYVESKTGFDLLNLSDIFTLALSILCIYILLVELYNAF